MCIVMTEAEEFSLVSIIVTDLVPIFLSIISYCIFCGYILDRQEG